MVQKKKYSSFSPEVRKLGIQYINGLEHIGFGTDFDWFDSSGLSYKDIVYIIQNGQTPDADRLRACQEKGLTVYDTKSFMLDMKDQSVQDDVRLSYSSMKHAYWNCGGGFSLKLRAAAMMALYGFCVTKWRHIFNSQGILGYVTVADTNLDALPQMHALESLGGVDLSYEFSATGYHAYMDCKPLGRHQYICWGDVSTKMIELCDEKVPYRIAPKEILYAGNMRMHLQQSTLPMHEGILKILKNVGERKRILVVDSATTHLKFLSVRALQSFYDSILDLISAYPDYFYTIKSQRDPVLREDQMTALKNHEMDGRLVYAPEFGLMHYLLPHVDLVIGMPIYASSVMEAASFRKPVICFNQLNWPHVVEEYMPQGSLVKNSQELIVSVEKALSGAIDYKAYSSSIDPFGDLKGYERFGFFLGLWVKYIRKAGSADKALAHVKEEYLSAWPVPRTQDNRKAG